MDDVLVSVCGKLLATGQEVSPREAATVEVLGQSFVLDNPRARRITVPERQWKEHLAIGELAWNLAGSDRADVLAYYAPNWSSFSDDGLHILGSCYGKLLFDKGPSGKSQWEAITELLRKDPASRRAVLHFGGVDLAGRALVARDLPCIASIQFLLRDGSLNCITSMRSNDVIWGLCYDVFLVTMLQELLSVQLSTNLGWYQHFAGSLHVYGYHVKLARRIAQAAPRASSEMAAMTSPEAVPAFLRAEEALRLGTPDAHAYVSSLPPYWRLLAEPLIGFQQSKDALTTSDTGPLENQKG